MSSKNQLITKNSRTVGGPLPPVGPPVTRRGSHPIVTPMPTGGGHQTPTHDRSHTIKHCQPVEQDGSKRGRKRLQSRRHVLRRKLIFLSYKTRREMRQRWSQTPPPLAPLPRWTRLVFRPAVVERWTQPTPRSRGVSLCTMRQRRRCSDSDIRHRTNYNFIRQKVDVIHKTGSTLMHIATPPVVILN